MKSLTDASQNLAAFVELLRTSGGFDLTAHTHNLASADGSTRPELSVEFTGGDASLLTTRNGELLHAMEHVAAKILRLETEDHDRISFDADGFKSKRDAELRRLAHAAIVKVQTTATAYIFPPMMSRERRLLHLALASSGLKTASTGERFQRSVVLYPEGIVPPQ